MKQPPASRTQDERPLLAVFLDGLGVTAVERMPFVASLPTVRRLDTELGYSVTCHASMYTGVRPDRHLLWFIWQRDEARSPFRWLHPLRFLDAVDNLPMHMLATKVARRFTSTSSWFGIPYPVHVPWRYLPQLDVSERRLWSDPGYLFPVPTMFDRLRDAGLVFEIVGMSKGRGEGLLAVEQWQPPRNPATLSYLFVGDVDHASHAYGQDSDEVTILLRRVDSLIRDRFEQLQTRGSGADLVLWSDHGHHDVERIDPFDLLARHSIGIDEFLHVIDTNFVRLWIDDDEERERIVSRLNEIPEGHVLDQAEMEHHRVSMPDDRYGNVIFYLDLPYAFTRTIWGFGRRLASAHGYLPDRPGSAGLFASSLPAVERPMHLVDVAPSILQRLGVDPGDDLDGSSVWR